MTMLKHLAIFLLFVSTNTFAGLSVNANCDYTLTNTFITCYSAGNRIPLYTHYIVTKEMVDAIDMPRRSGYHIERGIPKQHRSSNVDYRKSGYDRGHLAPNTIFNYTKKSQYDAFSLSNIVPQDRNLNRGLWRLVEKRVEELVNALGTDVEVVTGVCINSPTPKRLNNRVTVPTHFFKVLYYYIDNINIVEVFFVENKKPSSIYIGDHATKLSELNDNCLNMDIILQ